MGQDKRFWVVIGLLLSLVLAGGAYSTLSRRNTVKLLIDALPRDSQISINGTNTSSTTHHLRPGNYTISASHPGFTTASTTITIAASDVSKKIRLFPTPSDPGALTWASQHAEDYQKLEAEAGIETQQEGEDFEKKFPISSTLPYKNLLFSIDYSTNNTKNGFKLIITADTAVDRKYALQQIQDWGYDPGDYQIEFSGFTNPLEAPR